MKTSTEELARQIEKLVREHVAACREAAATAVERAFGAQGGGPSKARRTARVRSVTRCRRGPAEVAALGERLYEAVCAHPGEAMTVLAAQVGGSTRELHRPMTLLKRAGRVRTVGQRQHTRYFPMAAKASQSA